MDVLWKPAYGCPYRRFRSLRPTVTAGAFAIYPDTLELVGIVGTVRVRRDHPVGREYLDYPKGLLPR